MSDRLRAELANCMEARDAAIAVADLNRSDLIAQRAALARVRAVCANPPVPSRMLIPYILAALEGNQP